MTVQPRPTPAERADDTIQVEVDEALTVFAATLEDWVTPRQEWELVLREGHDRDRANNIEAADDTGAELLLRFEEHDGIAKIAHLTANGLQVELFHILTFT